MRVRRASTRELKTQRLSRAQQFPICFTNTSRSLAHNHETTRTLPIPRLQKTWLTDWEKERNEGHQITLIPCASLSLSSLIVCVALVSKITRVCCSKSSVVVPFSAGALFLMPLCAMKAWLITWWVRSLLKAELSFGRWCKIFNTHTSTFILLIEWASECLRTRHVEKVMSPLHCCVCLRWLAIAAI